MVILCPGHLNVADITREKWKIRTKDTGRPIPTHGKGKSALSPAASKHWLLLQLSDSQWSLRTLSNMVSPLQHSISGARAVFWAATIGSLIIFFHIYPLSALTSNYSYQGSSWTHWALEVTAPYPNNRPEWQVGEREFISVLMNYPAMENWYLFPM